MEKIQLDIDLEEALYMLSSGLNAIAAIQHAIAEGVNDPSSWTDGLQYVIIKMEDEIDALFKLSAKRETDSGAKIQAYMKGLE